MLLQVLVFFFNFIFEEIYTLCILEDVMGQREERRSASVTEPLEP